MPLRKIACLCSEASAFSPPLFQKAARAVRPESFLRQCDGSAVSPGGGVDHILRGCTLQRDLRVFFFFQFMFSYLYFNNNINTILSAWPNRVIHRYCLRDFSDHYELYWWIPWPIALHCDSNFKLCVVDKHHYYRVNVICLMMCMYMCKSERIIKLEALWSMGRT